MSYLKSLVTDKLETLSLADAARFFEVPPVTISRWKAGTSPIPISALEKVFDPSDPAGIKAQGPTWEGKKLAILLPWYKSAHPLTCFSLLTMLDRQKMSVMIKFNWALLSQTRNVLAETFLKSGLEWALTVDDDMVLPCGNAKWFNAVTGMALPEQFAGLHAADRLLSHGKTLVGALCYGRLLGSDPVFAEGKAMRQRCLKGPINECIPTRWIGTGCLLIHRSVFTDIEAKFPHLARNRDGEKGHWFTSSDIDVRESARKALEILKDESASPEARVSEAQKMMSGFEVVPNSNASLNMGEDVAFALRASAAGHQPHVDLGLICGHAGDIIYGPRTSAMK